MIGGNHGDISDIPICNLSTQKHTEVGHGFSSRQIIPV